MDGAVTGAAAGAAAGAGAEALPASTPLDVPVAGGDLRVGRFGPPAGADGAVVLAVHGITATHMAWVEVARHLPPRTVLAPDLRGRGRSAGLPGPYGFAAHVDDLVRVLDSAGVERAVVAGHSMGGFVAVALAARHPSRVAGLVLVDGGPPLLPPRVPAPRGGVERVLGPAAARLGMTFPDREAYRAFWRAHPAMGPIWGAAVQVYVDYDLLGAPPAMRPSCRVEAMRADGAEVNDSAGAYAALRRVTAPVVFLRAERGLLDEPRGLYHPLVVASLRVRVRSMPVRTLQGTNHYSILLAEPGAREVARAITAQLR